MKNSKNVNINYNFATGEWKARDNNKTIAYGQGIDSAVRFEKEIKTTIEKPVKFNWKW